MSRLAAICSDLLVMHYDLCFDQPSAITVAADKPFDGLRIDSDDGFSAFLPKNTEFKLPADVKGVGSESAQKTAVKNDLIHNVTSQQTSGVASDKSPRLFSDRAQSAVLQESNQKALDLISVLKDPTFRIDTAWAAENSYYDLGLAEDVPNIQTGKQSALDRYLIEPESKSLSIGSEMQDRERHTKQEQGESSPKTPDT